jgi:hypothetical protein
MLLEINVVTEISIFEPFEHWRLVERARKEAILRPEIRVLCDIDSRIRTDFLKPRTDFADGQASD